MSTGMSFSGCCQDNHNYSPQGYTCMTYCTDISNGILPDSRVRIDLNDCESAKIPE